MRTIGLGNCGWKYERKRRKYVEEEVDGRVVLNLKISLSPSNSDHVKRREELDYGMV